MVRKMRKMKVKTIKEEVLRVFTDRPFATINEAVMLIEARRPNIKPRTIEVLINTHLIKDGTLIRTNYKTKDRPKNPSIIRWCAIYAIADIDAAKYLNSEYLRKSYRTLNQYKPTEVFKKSEPKKKEDAKTPDPGDGSAEVNYDGELSPSEFGEKIIIYINQLKMAIKTKEQEKTNIITSAREQADDLRNTIESLNKRITNRNEKIARLSEYNEQLRTRGITTSDKSDNCTSFKLGEIAHIKGSSE